MESRVKAMQELILSSAVNQETSEHRNEREINHIEEDASNFSEDTEEDSEDNEPPKKKARRSISALREKGIQWFMNPAERTFNRLNSVPNFIAKGKGAAENVSSPIEAWSLLFSDDVLNIILKYSNQEIERSRHINTTYSSYKTLDMLELKAFIGLLYYFGRAKKKLYFFI